MKSISQGTKLLLHTHTHTHTYIYIYGERQQRLYCQKDDYGNGNIRTLNILYDKSIALILANLWTRNVHHKDESQHGNHVAYKAPPTCNHPAKPWLLSSRPKKKTDIASNPQAQRTLHLHISFIPGQRRKKKSDLQTFGSCVMRNSLFW
jgi:hypothetical protein